MKKIVFAAFTVLVCAQLYSCIGMRTVNGSGSVAEKTIVFKSDYSQLSVAGGITVVLSPEQTGTAAITADQAVMEYVSVTESNGRVRVCYDPNVHVNTKIETKVVLPCAANLSLIEVSSAGKVGAEQTIVSPELKISCSSAGRVRLNVESPDLRIEASSAGGCDIDALAGFCLIKATSSAKCKGRFDVRQLYAEVSSAAGCTLEGECDELNVSATSAASFRGFGLDAAKVFVNASSAGSVEVFAAEELGLTISSGASLKYKGAPQLAMTEVSSGASLKNAN